LNRVYSAVAEALVVTVYTWINLAIEYLQGARALPEFRRPLPPGFLQKGREAMLAAGMGALFDLLREKSDGSEVVRRRSPTGQAKIISQRGRS